MTAEQTKMVSRARAGERRLTKAAAAVSDRRALSKFIASLVRWADGDARYVGEILGDREWTYRRECALRKAAISAFEAAEKNRERYALRTETTTSRPVDAATRQYQDELKIMLAGSR